MYKHHPSSVRSHKRCSRVVNVIGYTLVAFFAYQLYSFISTAIDMFSKLTG